MYLTNDGRGYYRGTEQHASRGLFLLLLQRETDSAKGPIFAIVRRVALHQLGHWMMGHANIGGAWRSVSGAYGHDGLPLTVPVLPRDAVQLPDALREAWNMGGGWNGAGSEAYAMREFGLTLPGAKAR